MGYDMQFTDKTSSHAPLKRESSEANSRDTLVTKNIFIYIPQNKIYASKYIIINVDF